MFSSLPPYICDVEQLNDVSVMKKTILKLTLAICLVVTSYYLYLQKNNGFNDLVIKNIEALAEDEYHEEDVYCYGTGSIDCYGDKVEMKIEGYRL